MRPVVSKNFCVGLHELEDGPRELEGTVSAEWLDKLLDDTDVRHGSDEAGRLSLVLTKNGPDVLVQGFLDVTIGVPCARTLDPAIYRIRPDIFLLLSPKSGAPATPKSPRRAHGKKNAATRAGGRHSDEDQDEELSGEEAARDTYSGDQIVLDEFLREFILLEVPMIPLREDLRDLPFEANPPLPGDQDHASGNSASRNGASKASEVDSLDPRLSPLREIKARLEKKE